MDDEELKKLHTSIKEKLGEDGFAKISDDMATIITGNKINLQAISEKDEMIGELKTENEGLVKTNGRLFQQIAMGEDETEKQSEDKPQSSLSWKDAFDEKGNFKH